MKKDFFNFASSRRSILFSCLLIAILLGLDVLSKLYVHTHLPLLGFSSSEYPYGGIGVFHNWLGIDFAINHAINTGAAWGMFAAAPHLLLFVRIVALIAMAVYLCFFNEQPSFIPPFLVIIAGALGNVIDSFVYGHVVDMFHLVLWGYSFPVFNVADSAIFCGVSWFFLYSYVVKKKKQYDHAAL